ncbi:GNAT family N-acetyltransferase [Enterococcus sp. BWR-S5]|uniref:GNAT family N-acetyltransferase n=1 Tax=Enterococcus sp. BWR-S5 TaxID=2787714 RepID=UPI001922E018|nr:GNAT family protein [Enterococcus sp. BWR-S5]MBL1223771.1 GNAT family N-acetyltransferase [Enterococcus sp. BWR-S5]
MTQEEIEITIREAIPDDAAQVARVLQQVGGETPYLVMDGKGAAFDVEEMAHNFADLYASENNVLMVAIIDEQIVGTASVSASAKKRMEHLGEVGISILKEYWGFGLGYAMMMALVDWASESGVIRRLELTVQERNTRAIKLYEKVGFQTEAIMHRGAKTDENEFLDVRLMSLMID